MTKIKRPETEILYQDLKDIGASQDESAHEDDLAQEILDFLAMAAGFKPVFLLGRGMDAPGWLLGVANVASEAGFRVIEGPYWDATPFGKFPDWYKDQTQAQLAPFTATYISADRETADQIDAIKDADGRLSITLEAQLLGYPDCCVAVHYDRAVQYHQAIFSILKRHAGGDDAQMQALLRGGATLGPATPEEIAHMEVAFDLNPAPFGSWNQCQHCARHNDSPSAKLSEQYKNLAETTDLDLLRTLSRV